LVDRRVRNVGFFAIAAEEGLSAADRAGALLPAALVQAADLVEELALEAQVRFLWYPPVTRDPRRSLSAQVRGGPRCSGDHTVRIEPDGAVIPARGPWRAAGNLLAHEWQAIQEHSTWRAYRERLLSPTHCETCPGLAICAADCPRSPLGWADDRARPDLDAGRPR
jgi:radical SAM protein with 4Fe4S-binding SPASM domain